MRRTLLILAAFLAATGPLPAAGMLIPAEKTLPPLAMLDHKVEIRIEDQVATVYIEQTFRNHTDRQLEATYLLPVPKDAAVNDFYMWVGPTKVKGELVEADKARKIYSDIVQRTKDPGLLEYMGTRLLRMKVFPVPARGDQKVAVKYTYLATNDNGLVEYLYPLKSEGKSVSTLEKFSIDLRLKSQHPITNIYSPTHAITISRPSEKEAIIGFEKDQAILDKDFQLFYTPGSKDVGLTALTHRPNGDQPGHFMLLISPRAELSKSQQVPRDMVFVLDTSGSMRGKRMTQAINALKYCLSNLTPGDNFAIMNFATTVTKYANNLQPATPENVEAAKKWVDRLEATGGTAIDDALRSAFDMRTNDKGRTFTIVFFTDGRPTIGETRMEKILQNVEKQNTKNTRIFSFGVGDDVNAALLDALADNSRAISTYVRESEDIEAKVSSLYGKISNPVLSNLKLTIGEGVVLSEIYPPQLPDLFHGSQLVVLGRYSGKGHAAITLTGTVGMEEKQFVYELKFADKTTSDKAFVEDLWARRKVGYLLDQIRLNGEKKELVDEVVSLAKRYGITTPYTSYLLVPDSPTPVASAPPPPNQGGPGVPPGQNPMLRPGPQVPQAFQPGFGLGGLGGPGGPGGGMMMGMGGGLAFNGGTGIGGGLGGLGGGYGGGFAKGNKGANGKGGIGTTGRPTSGSSAAPAPATPPPKTVTELAKRLADEGKRDGDKTGDSKAPDITALRSYFNYQQLAQGYQQHVQGEKGASKQHEAEAIRQQFDQLQALDRARQLYSNKQHKEAQGGKLGVDLAVQNNGLRFQNRLTQTANRFVQSRNLIDVGGIWIDEKFTPKMQTLVVKAQSAGYFRLLERRPEMKEVLALGNYLVWVSPSGMALIIDQNDGQDTLTDEAIDRLFAAPAKQQKK